MLYRLMLSRLVLTNGRIRAIKAFRFSTRGPKSINVNVKVNAKIAIAKRLAVHIMNPDRMHETNKFSADDGKQLEIRKQ
jgi:hypothetical protein